jgi:membrane-associated protease RseP (regulator of RpoE activity)
LASLFLVSLLIGSLAAVAVARRTASHALAMRGVNWFLGGAIEDAEGAAWWRRAIVVLAAVATSYAVPALGFAVAGLAGGNGVWSTEVSVAPEKPAAIGGMRSGDRVISVGGKPVAIFADLAPALAEHGREPVEVVLVRGAEEVRLTVTPEGPTGRARIGVSPRGKLERGFLGSLAIGATEPLRVLAAIVRVLLATASGTPTVEVMGPVGIVRETARASASGVGDVLYLIALMVTYVWPIAAITAVVTVPRRAKRRE